VKCIILLSFITFFAAFTCKAASVHISGKSGDYALNTIELYTFHDFITEEKVKLGTFRFNQEGAFNLTVEIDETSFCMADFDGYQGLIYLEPGKSYEIALPPKKKQTEAQKRNPFEKPETIWFGLLHPDKDDLNYKIQLFEQEYAKLENKYFDQIFVNQWQNSVDSVKQKLDKVFPRTNQALFESHKLFRKANLDFALNQGKSSKFMEIYFNAVGPVYNLGAYAVIFNQIFSDYFNTLITSKNSSTIRSFINAGNLPKIEEYFVKELHFNKELSHLVILKSLHDAYYNRQFSKTSVLNMLTRIKSSGWSKYEKETALLITEKLVYLNSGTFPPSIVLRNINGQLINLANYRHSYVYLHFTHPQNAICRQHLDKLKAIAAHYKDKLVIINIIPDAKKFKNDKDWVGTFATSETSIETSYNVKTFPSSFLIGKDGRLLLSPAPNPIDGFDQQMGQILKSDHFRELQKDN
jgi:hypothetical protein